MLKSVQGSEVHAGMHRLLPDQVSRNDYLDARAILNWNADSASLVAGSKTRERMNEYKTHLNWAKKTVYLSEVFGITE